MRDFRNSSSDKLPKRAFRARLPQLFKEQASKTSISCEASSTFQSRSFQSLAPATQNAKMTSHLESLKRQNEHFVRYFLQISHFQLENRRFRASFSYKTIFTELKKYDFCPRSFRHFSRQSPNHAPATIFAVVSPLRVPAIAIRGNSTFATSQNAAPATTSRKATSQSAAPATKKRHACIDTLPKYCACHAKHQNNLTFCDLGSAKTSISCETSSTFHTLKVQDCDRSANVPPNSREINELATTTRRRHDDEATTTRRRGDDDTTTARGTQREHRSNPRPQL